MKNALNRIVGMSKLRLRSTDDFKFLLPEVDSTGLQKKFPGINFQYSVSFSTAEYEYETLFSYHV